VCDKLPMKFRDVCRTFVSTYLPKLIELLIQKQPPEVVCKEIGLCPKAQENAVPCVLCQFVITEVEKLLEDHRTEEAIIKALDKVCEKLPVGVRDLCKHFVETYLPKLIELLIQKQPPEVVCKELGLCPKHMEEEETNGVSCELCKMVVEEAKKLIKDYSEKGVKEALEKVCDFLPPILSGACKVFVDKYSDKLIDMLLKKMSAEAICKSLGLCHKSVENGVSCTLCQFVIMEVEKLLHDERTEESIIKALDHVCHRLPPVL